MWITAFLNFVLYVPMALVVIYDRTVVIHAWRIRFPRNQGGKHKSQSRYDRVLALKMLVYGSPSQYGRALGLIPASRHARVKLFLS